MSDLNTESPAVNAEPVLGADGWQPEPPVSISLGNPVTDPYFYPKTCNAFGNGADSFASTVVYAGGWTMKTAKGIVDGAGDVHPLEGDAQTVAEIISNEAGATVTAEDVRALWAILAMAR